MAQQEYGFFQPAKLIFAKEALSQVAEQAKKLGSKVLVVTDKPMKATGLLDPILEDLKKIEMPFEIWDDIVPNPRDTDIDKGGDFAKEVGVDVLIALGGGSVMDTAKAIGGLITNGGKTKDWYGDKLVCPIAPLICVPTTCGTGSEVTHESGVIITRSRWQFLILWY
ncbi:MAG: iron-containing alcohol dehydrogenase [Anaerostipes sp.]|nr:iron-containing alcohol dehydrogenase [Anaerostipes sp.]